MFELGNHGSVATRGVDDELRTYIGTSVGRRNPFRNTDFAPTLFDFAGTEVPAEMHGHSFKPVLETGVEPEDWRTATYYRYWYQLVHHFNPAHFGLRTKRYKLIFFYGLDHLVPEARIQTPPGWEFYDLEKDPGEMNNLYDDPGYADIIAELKTELKSLRERYGETDKDFPHIQEIIDAHWDTTDESQEAAKQRSHAARIAFEQALAAETGNGLKATVEKE